jgi:hypothetical protein
MMCGLFARLCRRYAKRDDQGVALLTVVLFLAVAGALATAVTVVSIGNEQNANRDRQAGGALQTAEGGVAQAIQLMRTVPVGYFTCQEPALGASPSGACTTNPAGWTNATTPMKVSSDGTVGTCKTNLACFGVWISTVTPYSAGAYALLRVHSTGLFGGGPAARSLVVDVKVTPDKFPIGIFANSVSSGGTFGINHESLFSIQCINHRAFDSYTATTPPVPNTTSGGGGISFSGMDPQYGIPAAAHSTQYVTQANSGCSGGTTNSRAQANVHDSSQGWSPCNASDMYDQDSQGAALSSSCPGYAAFTDSATGLPYPTTSKFTMSDMQAHGYRPGGLSPNEYAALKSMAQSMGTYFTSATTSPFAALTAANATNGVIFYDLPSGGSSTVTLKPADIPNLYFRSYNDTTTSCVLPSLVIIVRNGSLTYNTSGGNTHSGALVSSMFVPDGNYNGQGNADIIGTLFAQTMANVTGTQNWFLDQCFVANPPGPVMSIRVMNYREVDTQNIN